MSVTGTYVILPLMPVLTKHSFLLPSAGAFCECGFYFCLGSRQCSSRQTGNPAIVGENSPAIAGKELNIKDTVAFCALLPPF